MKRKDKKKKDVDCKFSIQQIYLLLHFDYVSPWLCDMHACSGRISYIRFHVCCCMHDYVFRFHFFFGAV